MSFWKKGVFAAPLVVAFLFVGTPANATAVSGPDIVGTPPSATIGERYSYQFAISGGEGLHVRSVDVPLGLRVDTYTGLISGTPAMNRSGDYTFSLIVRDNQSFVRKSFTVRIDGARNYTQIGSSSTQHVETLTGHESKAGIDVWCPPEYPYLINQHLAFGRVVPHGVHIQERGFAGDDEGGSVTTVSAGAQYRHGFQAGVKAMLMTNNTWVSPTITVTLHCTNDQNEAQPF